MQCVNTCLGFTIGSNLTICFPLSPTMIVVSNHSVLEQKVKENIFGTGADVERRLLDILLGLTSFTKLAILTNRFSPPGSSLCKL